MYDYLGYRRILKMLKKRIPAKDIVDTLMNDITVWEEKYYTASHNSIKLSICSLVITLVMLYLSTTPSIYKWGDMAVVYSMAMVVVIFTTTTYARVRYRISISAVLILLTEIEDEMKEEEGVSNG